MDDHQGTSFIDLLSQCVARCVLDWRCFCERQASEQSFVDDHARTGMIQFCRSQREIFLKLYLLHEFMREQNRLDRVLESVYSFENYLDKCGSDIAMNLRRLQAADLMAPAPNTALAVDLLSSGRYSRMPQMLPQLAEAAISNAVPLPPMSDAEADLTVDRIYSEYRWQFRRSGCPAPGVSMECRNGQCVLERAGFFSVTLVYDFFAWQALAAEPLLLERFGCSTDGEARASFLTMVVYAVALFNTAKRGNIFDAVFACANVYCGKLLMERLKGQAADYKALQLAVTDHRFFASGDADHQLISCSDVALAEGELLVLEVECFPGFRYEDVEGLTLRFEMCGRGDVRVAVVELPELLCERQICEHRLEQWLDRCAALLERYQLDRIGGGNLFMNYATGALHLSGLALPFSLAEASMLIAVMAVRSTLLTDVVAGEPPVDTVPRDQVRRVWRKWRCPHCEEAMDEGARAAATTTTALSEPLKDFVCDFWFYLEDRPGAVHGTAAYLLDLGVAELVEHGIATYLAVVTHGEHVAGNAVLALRGSAPVGTVSLSGELGEYPALRPMLTGLLSLVVQLGALGEFSTEPLAPHDARVTASFEGVGLTVNASGDCDSVTHDGVSVSFHSSADALSQLRTVLGRG